MHLFGDQSHLNRLQLFVGVGAASLAGALVYLITCIFFKLEEPIMVAARVPMLKRFAAKPAP
jgi:hypothetical protein